MHNERSFVRRRTEVGSSNTCTVYCIPLWRGKSEKNKTGSWGGRNGKNAYANRKKTSP